MKRASIVFVAWLFILSGGANIAVAASVKSFEKEEPILSIRRQYASINRSLKKYRVVKKDLSGFSTEGGELTAYFDGAAIVKIAVINYGETNNFFEEFYYSKEKLIFVYRKQEIYDKPMSKVSKRKENRFYFNDDKLIRWVDENGKQVAPGNSLYPERRTHYLNISRLFIEGARSLTPMIEAPERNP
jgi:hypothetical protein